METRMRVEPRGLRRVRCSTTAIPRNACRKLIGTDVRAVAAAGTGSLKSNSSIGAILIGSLLFFVGDSNDVRVFVQLDNAPTALAHLRSERRGAGEGLEVVAYDFPGV